MLVFVKNMIHDALWTVWQQIGGILQKQAQKTSTTLDDTVVNMVASRETFEAVWAAVCAKLFPC
jgi:hypothetical protein